MPQGSTPESASFTCNTCGVVFVAADLQRQHMKTDWHRYNLKRRVAELPSISSDVFAEKILQLQKGQEESNEDEYGFHVYHRKPSASTRQLTKKILRQQEKRGRLSELAAEKGRAPSPSPSIASEFSEFSLGDSIHVVTDVESNADSEVLGRSHSEYSDLGASSDDSEFEDLGSEADEIDEDEALPVTHCFFCDKHHSEIEANVKHMFSAHGLYIPERSFLVDLEGFLLFVSELVTVEHCCLACGFEARSLEGIRQHVKSKGHCKIPYETKEERAAMAHFYDFSIDEVKPSTSTKKVAFAGEGTTTDDEVDNEDDGGENEPTNYSIVQVDPSGVELTLPTGPRIGHRSMVRYYKQNLPAGRTLNDSEKTVAAVDRRYAPGMTSNEVTKQEKTTRLLVQKATNDHYRKTKSYRANFQPHFRDEMLG